MLSLTIPIKSKHPETFRGALHQNRSNELIQGSPTRLFLLMSLPNNGHDIRDGSVSATMLLTHSIQIFSEVMAAAIPKLSKKG